MRGVALVLVTACHVRRWPAASLLIEACAGWIKKRKKGDDMRDHASVYVEVKGERCIRIWRVRNEESVGFHHAIVSYFVLYNN